VAAGTRELLRQHKIPSSRLLTVGAGAPGITDVDAGIVISAPHLSRWQNVPLRQLLQERLQVPVVIENDVNLGALGESWCGAARGIRNFVFLAIGTGIGAGIFVNGCLHRGDDWAAGEVGYMHVPGATDGMLELDRPGPLESAIGGAGIERAWRHLCHGRHASTRQATQIFECAQAGDPAARRLLQGTARMLADAVLNISLVLNSSLVVFGGGVGTSQPLFETTRRIIERNQFARPRLALSVLGKDAQLFGAVRLALDHAEARLLEPCP
jgi:glucokinase